MKRPTLFKIVKTALYIGTIGYGGPAILALMKKVIVNEKAWISEEEFMNALSLSQILPGAVGVTLFGYIGHKLANMVDLYYFHRLPDRLEKRCHLAYHGNHRCFVVAFLRGRFKNFGYSLLRH